MFSNIPTTASTMSVFNRIQAGTNWDSSALDPNIPAWKRELILKKRAAARSTVASVHLPTSNEPRAFSTRPLSATNEALPGSAGRVKWCGTGSHQRQSSPAAVVHPEKVHASGTTKHSRDATKQKGAGGYADAKLNCPQQARGRSKSVSDSGDSNRRPLIRMGEEQGELCRASDSDGQTAPSPSFSSFSDGFAYEYDSDIFIERRSTLGGQDREEYEYGPGIVDRLRCKFINLTVREEQQQSFSGDRPMRRVASLEDLLDEGFTTTDARAKRKFASSKAGAPSKVRKLDILKKAYSMETLTAIDKLVPAGGKNRLYDDDDDDVVKATPNLLINENVVIIEHSKRSRSVDTSGPVFIQRDLVRRHGSITIEEEELPRPDTVRIYKKMFEKNTVTKTSRQVSNKSGIAVVKSSAHMTTVAKQQGHISKKTPSAKVSWMEEAAASGLLKPSALNNDSSLLDIHQHDNRKVETKTDKTLFNGHRHEPNDAEVLDSDDNVIGIKKISGESLQRIRAASEVSCFFGPINQNQSRPKENATPTDGKPSNSSTTTNRPRIVDVRPKTDEKPIGMIKPITVAVPAEQKENLINQVKTAMAKNNMGIGIPILNGTIESHNSAEKTNKIALKKTTSSTAEPTSMVFNFVDKTNVTPKISNTQRPVQRPLVRIDKSSGKLVSNLFQGSEASAIVFIPGIPTTASSDYDDEDDFVTAGDPILPCGIEFEGENVLIGRSCLLQKRNKQLKISFDDNATDTYEYPSEVVVLEDYLAQHEGDGEPASNPPPTDAPESAFTTPSLGSGLKTTPALNSTGGLGNYVPSKLSEGDTFELGVSRPASLEVSQTNSTTSAVPTDVDDMIIKPAEDNEASSWSTAQTAETDLLF